ncbi:MAG: hypothetical protein ACKOWE_06650 [Micrococcales bacterium]
MARKSYPLRRYARYRTILNAGGASVGISELKANPIRYIHAADARPIKVLRYGHLRALIISPEFYDDISIQLEDARAEVANLKVLLGTISEDLLRFWEHQPAEFIPTLQKYQHQSTRYLPKLVESYVKGVDEILDDLENESENGSRSEPDPRLKRLLEHYNRKKPKK